MKLQLCNRCKCYAVNAKGCAKCQASYDYAIEVQVNHTP